MKTAHTRYIRQDGHRVLRNWLCRPDIHHHIPYNELCRPDLFHSSDEIQRWILAGYSIDHAGRQHAEVRYFVPIRQSRNLSMQEERWAKR